MSPKMARFIRGKVKRGGYTNASEVVRTALRRMQAEEAREARLARSSVDDILAGLSGDDRAQITGRERAHIKCSGCGRAETQPVATRPDHAHRGTPERGNQPKGAALASLSCASLWRAHPTRLAPPDAPWSSEGLGLPWLNTGTQRY